MLLTSVLSRSLRSRGNTALARSWSLNRVRTKYIHPRRRRSALAASSTTLPMPAPRPEPRPPRPRPPPLPRPARPRPPRPRPLRPPRVLGSLGGCSPPTSPSASKSLSTSSAARSPNPIPGQPKTKSHHCTLHPRCPQVAQQTTSHTFSQSLLHTLWMVLAPTIKQWHVLPKLVDQDIHILTNKSPSCQLPTAPSTVLLDTSTSPPVSKISLTSGSSSLSPGGAVPVTQRTRRDHRDRCGKARRTTCET